jgi:hypothetical protein
MLSLLSSNAVLADRLSLRCGFAHGNRAQPAAQIETCLFRSLCEGFILSTSEPQTDGIFLTLSLGPESTFSSMKRVFGDTLRSKGMDAQTNELLLKVIAYNIVCVVHSIFELGVTVPGLSVCTQKALAAHNVAC